MEIRFDIKVFYNWYRSKIVLEFVSEFTIDQIKQMYSW